MTSLFLTRCFVVTAVAALFGCSASVDSSPGTNAQPSARAGSVFSPAITAGPTSAGSVVPGGSGVASVSPDGAYSDARENRPVHSCE